MTIEDVVRNRVEEVGITAAELARRCNMNDQLLRRSLDGKRNLKCDELIRLCNQLDLSLEDFKNAA